MSIKKQQERIQELKDSGVIPKGSAVDLLCGPGEENPKINKGTTLDDLLVVQTEGGHGERSKCGLLSLESGEYLLPVEYDDMYLAYTGGRRIILEKRSKVGVFNYKNMKKTPLI